MLDTGRCSVCKEPKVTQGNQPGPGPWGSAAKSHTPPPNPGMPRCRVVTCARVWTAPHRIAPAAPAASATATAPATCTLRTALAFVFDRVPFEQPRPFDIPGQLTASHRVARPQLNPRSTGHISGCFWVRGHDSKLHSSRASKVAEIESISACRTRHLDAIRRTLE